MSLKQHFLNMRDRPTISDLNVSPVIQILAWLFLSFSILAVATQIATKRALSRSLGPSDILLLVALVLAVSQIATLLSPAGQVIGDSAIGLPSETVQRALKALYGGNILSVLTLVAIKGSVLAAVYALTPVAFHRKVIIATSIVVVAWGITAVFAVAFQCPLPQAWDVLDQRCTNIRAASTYSAVMNLLTDVALLIIPSMVIVPLQMRLGARLAILGAFWFRIIVVAATVIQIIYIQRLVFNEHFLNNVWQTVICQESIQVTSIISACIPFLKPFLMSLESGFLRADDEYRRTNGTMYGTGEESSRSGASRRALRYIKMGNQQSRDTSVKLDDSPGRETKSNPK